MRSTDSEFIARRTCRLSPWNSVRFAQFALAMRERYQPKET